MCWGLEVHLLTPVNLVTPLPFYTLILAHLLFLSLIVTEWEGHGL